MTISKSPARHTFQQNDTNEDFWRSVREEDAIREQDPAWQKDNLEYDLRSTEWICDKVKGDEVYAQHLYAAMCNRDFQKLDVMPILKDQRWSCSWRHAGGIIADMRGEGDYIDWYCSGIVNEEDLDLTQADWDMMTEEAQHQNRNRQAVVGEGTVTHEIKSDLKKLGWVVLHTENE